MADKLYRITRTTTIGPEYLLTIIMPDNRPLVVQANLKGLRVAIPVLRAKGYIGIHDKRRELR